MSGYEPTNRVPHGIMFHHFHGGRHDLSQGSITADRLSDLLEYVGKRNRILEPGEWVEKSQNDSLLGDEVCLTFDDALLCQYEIALPVLETMDIHAFFFVYSAAFDNSLPSLEIFRSFRHRYFDSIDDFYAAVFAALEESKYSDLYRSAIADFEPVKYLVEFPFYSDADRKFRFVRDQILGAEKYDELMNEMINAITSRSALAENLWMNDEHLQSLHSNGHTVGLHSYSHPTTMTNLSAAEQTREYELNSEHLRRIAGRRPTTMSHPSNQYGDHALSVLRELGIVLGFRANMAVLDYDYSELEIPREDHINVVRMMENTKS